MALNRKTQDLEPVTRDMVEKGIAILKAQGIRFFVNETRRSNAVQSAYFAQGRESLDRVNALRAIAGLWPITESENSRKVTNTLKSKHIEGKAVDIVPADRDGNPLWNAPKQAWEAIAVVMKSTGLEWGGDWAGAWDKPHYQRRD